MNVGRAKQIIESPEEIIVHYQGEPVWIQHVDEKQETAQVYTRENPDEELTVSVAELKEIH